MNTPNQHLWELIDSMTPAEKRYYKTHFSSDSNQHTLLFDHLNSQSIYDQEKAKAYLKVSSSQFKVVKAQLYSIIMKSLIAQKGKRHLKSSIRLGLEEVDLLLEREHYAAAMKKLKQLGQKCTAYGFTLYQYEITERLYEIQYLELDFSDPETHKYYNNLQHYQAILAQKQELSSIQVKLSAWTPFMPMRYKVIRQIKEDLYKMQGEYLDFDNLLTWYQCIATCLELLGRIKEPQAIRQQILFFFEENKHLQEDLPLSYLNALIHIVNPSLNNPDSKTVDRLTQKAEKIIAIYPQYSPHYIYFLWARLQAYYFNYQWRPIIQRMDSSCMLYIEKYQLQSTHTTIKILVILATTHLINENYSEAEDLLERFRKTKILKNQALIYVVNILELCLLWESQQIEELNVSVQRFKRQMRMEEEVYSVVFNIHLDLFSVLVKTPFLLSEKASETLLSVSEHPYDPILDYYSLLNLERWLQASAVRKKWKDIITPNNM